MGARPHKETAKRKARSIVQATRRLRTREVARLLGTSPSQVRRFVHAGVCRPSRRGRAFEFSFQDVVLLRSAQGLLASGLSSRRVRRALGEVARRLGERPLSSLRFRAFGNRIVVHEGSHAWNSESGQLLFSFEPRELARNAEVITPRQSPFTRGERRSPERNAGDWFERAVALEEAGDIAAAAEAYRKVLALEPGFVDASVNLGRVLHQQGRLSEAAVLYRRALAGDPCDAVAHYNLALVYEDQSQPNLAIEHYRRALDAAPDFADAHYNLARLFEERGRHADAVRHMLQYSKLTAG